MYVLMFRLLLLARNGVLIDCGFSWVGSQTDFVFFVSKGNPFLLLFYSTVAGVVPCGGRKMSTRTSSVCRLYFRIIEPVLVILKIKSNTA